MKSENTMSDEEVETKTVNGQEYICNIQLSWKECFKFWIAFAAMGAITFTVFVSVLYMFDNYVFDI